MTVGGDFVSQRYEFITKTPVSALHCAICNWSSWLSARRQIYPGGWPVGLRLPAPCKNPSCAPGGIYISSRCCHTRLSKSPMSYRCVSD